MANWISSKLKVAETFLQQIDQQAAESLGKGEKPQTDDLDFRTSTKNTETKPLKDQLKKKTPEYNDSIGKLRREHNVKVLDQNISDQSRSNTNNCDKEVVATANLGLKLSSNSLTDNDWTELLSATDKKAASEVNRNGNRLLEVQIPGRDGKQQGSLGSGKNLLASDGKRSQKAQFKSSRSSRKSDVKLESNVHDGGWEGRVSEGEDVMAMRSSFEPRDGGISKEKGHLDQGDNILEVAGENKGNDGGNVQHDGSMDGDKLESRDVLAGKGSVIGSTMAAMEFDEKMGLNNNEKFNNRGLNGSVDSSSRSTLMRKGSSPSDGESDSETDSTSSSGSESEHEREERRKRRQQILAEKAAAKAVEVIKDRENLVAKLEGEKESLEKILEERAKQQAQEASELQTSMIEVMEAVELEKQKHNNTRMEALARVAKLETINVDLARSLATAQWNLEIAVDRAAELRQKIELKEATHEDMRRRISDTQQSSDKLAASKGVELELEMLKAEYSFLTDKVGQLQGKAKTLEASIQSAQSEVENPTEVEVELKQRLRQLTDHLIQKQAQVEALSSEKATLQFKIEAVSRLLDEDKSTLAKIDLESGFRDPSNSKLRPVLEERLRSGKQHLESLILQLDSIFCAGALFLRRNSTARIWSLVYFVCLHLWVIFILLSHSPVTEDVHSGAVVSLENINNTGGV